MCGFSSDVKPIRIIAITCLFFAVDLQVAKAAPLPALALQRPLPPIITMKRSIMPSLGDPKDQLVRL